MIDETVKVIKERILYDDILKKKSSSINSNFESKRDRLFLFKCLATT